MRESRSFAAPIPPGELLNKSRVCVNFNSFSFECATSFFISSVDPEQYCSGEEFHNNIPTADRSYQSAAESCEKQELMSSTGSALKFQEFNESFLNKELKIFPFMILFF